ncbi:hypothetical protein M0E84_10350 [Corynebacterium sp. CCM 9186]|uniref:hypothetical protein n=1 Tax=Corynebacterium meridianum TaxID=2765363 RepID=UPI00200345FC|nr:hypothetical protein [Corynebacterium meridianum]MCK7678423.1 hypothetical protein [Corynebacterium meridianum]
MLLFRSLAFVVELPVDDEDVGVLDERFDEVLKEDVGLLEDATDLDSDDDVGLAVSSDSDVEALVFTVDDAVVAVVDAVSVEEGAVEEDEAPDVVDSVVDDSVDSVVEDGALVPVSVVGCPEVAAPASSSPMYM